jgi:hypothetical protein
MKTSILTSLGLRALLRPSLVLGGLALVAAPIIGSLSLCHYREAESAVRSSTVALELDATDDAACYYESAFNDGTLRFDRSAIEGRPLHLTQRYQWLDGCTWEAEETLIPHGSLFAYSYNEHVVACEEGATPARACERHGVVSLRSLP